MIASAKRPPSNAFCADRVAHLLHLVVERRAEKVRRHHAAVVELGRQIQPLPDLRARNFRRRGVLHEIVERDGAAAAQPGLDILHADADVLAQARLGVAALVDVQQVGAARPDTSSRATPS